jgi:hypothetical protein
MITIEIDDRSVLAALAALQRKVGNLSPALKEIGEDLVDSTQRRFAATTAPDGQRWAPNSQSTILRYLATGSKTTTKAGKLNAKGISMVIASGP